MCVKGNPKSCPQNLSSIDTQTSDTDEKVLEGKEVSGDSSESYICEKEEDDDPFFTCFGEMSDKDFHHMILHTLLHSVITYLVNTLINSAYFELGFL